MCGNCGKTYFFSGDISANYDDKTKHLFIAYFSLFTILSLRTSSLSQSSDFLKDKREIEFHYWRFVYNNYPDSLTLDSQNRDCSFVFLVLTVFFLAQIIGKS